MNTKLLKTKTFEEWCICMQGEYGMVDWKEVDAKSDNPCYIPYCAKSLNDIQSYQDMRKEVDEWLEDNFFKIMLKSIDCNPTPDDLVVRFFQLDNLRSSFSTWLTKLKLWHR